MLPKQARANRKDEIRSSSLSQDEFFGKGSMLV